MQQLEEWSIDRLIDYARNPRKNDHAVDTVAAAIREFGFKVPIVAKSDGTVVDGHLRLKAAKKLKLATVPVLLADDLTDAQVRAFRLSVNKLAELAEWDSELLANELSDLHADEFDMALLGFDADELEKMMGFQAGEIEPPELASGDREPFQQMAFMMHDTQVKIVKKAIDQAKQEGPFDGLNENSNGNALARIAEAYCG